MYNFKCRGYVDRIVNYRLPAYPRQIITAGGFLIIDGNDDRIGYLMITIGHSAKYPGEEVLLEKADVKQLIEKLQIHYLRMVE